MAEIVPYDFEGAAVRVVPRDGAPWFVLADVCRVLGIGNPSDAARRLDEDERHTLDSRDTLDTIEGLAAPQVQSLTIINESGLYSLILTSRKAAAKRFKRWVTGEVLPAIRRTGGYMVAAPEETPEALAARALAVLQATVERQKAQVAALAPKADALDLIARTDGALSVTAAAKTLQMRPRDLFGFLQRAGWIYRRPGGAAFLGYAAKTNAGLLEHKIATVSRQDGSDKVVEQVLVTPLGLTRLATLVRQAAPPATTAPQ